MKCYRDPLRQSQTQFHSSQERQWELCDPTAEDSDF